MDEETIKEYQGKYGFTNENIIWTKTSKFVDLPKIGQTYFFIQTDGAIYIGTVLKTQGLNVYITRIEKNINNILEVEKGKETKLIIDYRADVRNNNTNQNQNIIMWAEIPKYDSADDLSNDLNNLSLDKKEKINEILIKESQELDDIPLNILTNNNQARSPPVKKKITTAITGTKGKRFGGSKRRKKGKKRKTIKRKYKLTK